MSDDEEQRWVAEWSRRFQRRMATDRVDLGARARTLARRFDLPAPSHIRWTDMETRWGSCTPAEGSVRISSAVARFPTWVLDYVIVHELAHLRCPDHSPAFWTLVERYPKAERARGYLIAKSGMEDDDERAVDTQPR
jgi:predicted metal-dependent hydrolase